MFYFRPFSVTLFLLHGLSTTTSQSISTLTGSQVELTCNYRIPSNGIISWKNLIDLSQNTQILDNVPVVIKPRLNITGNHSNGEYNLMISDVKMTDAGTYECRVYGDASKVQSQQLIVIDGPTRVHILNKQDNRLLGTEGQGLLITCTANGGDPAPNLVLMIGSKSYISRNTHSIEQNVTRISRFYDDVNVSCQAVYDGIISTLLTDTAVIRLDLKPLPPAFNMNQVVTENTKSLVITCTSTGSRPAPSDMIWLIGNSNQDITSSSILIISPQPDDTYTATSTLTYQVPKHYNQQNMTCGFKNTATGNNYIQITHRINVRYAATVSVQNRTFALSQKVREIHCNIDGNPNSSFIKWQQTSKYGVVIREFDQGSTLVLPEQTEDNRYQDTGEYVCITSNGIKDEAGNLNQNGSGYVVSEAPPMFALYTSWTREGEIRKTVNISIDVYSVPSPLNFVWHRDETLVSGSGYKTSSLQATVKVMFQGQEVEVIGYQTTLTIVDVQESDFTTYKIRVTNSRGSVEQGIQLKSSTNNVAVLAIENDTVKGAAAGISVVTVISIIINMVLAYKCVAGRRKLGQLHKEQPGSDTNDMGCYDNIPETVDENSLVDDAKYESLGAKNKPNVYDDFGKNRGDAQCTLYSNTVV